MIGHLLALAVPAAGILIVLVCLFAPTAKPMRPGTATKPEGSDRR